MILSVSRRTDIPAYYAAWFMNRLRDGYVLTQNPMNPKQISRVSLSPDVVDCIVFWTKDPQPMFEYLNTLDAMGYPYYFQFTLTPYDNRIERYLRSKQEIETTFRELSKRLGKNRVVWRYDPILYAEHIDLSYHQEQLRRLCTLLEGYTDMVVISFADLYRKLGNPLFTAPPQAERDMLAVYIGETAPQYGIRPVVCCEAEDYTRYGIGSSSCIDKARIESVIGSPICVRRDKNQRSGCGCVESIDVGIYHTCPNGCIYCYANDSYEKARNRYFRHDPSSPLLYGEIPPDAVIREKTSVSLRETQLRIL